MEYLLPLFIYLGGWSFHSNDYKKYNNTHYTIGIESQLYRDESFYINSLISTYTNSYFKNSNLLGATFKKCFQIICAGGSTGYVSGYEERNEYPIFIFLNLDIQYKLFGGVVMFIPTHDPIINEYNIVYVFMFRFKVDL